MGRTWVRVSFWPGWAADATGFGGKSGRAARLLDRRRAFIKVVQNAFRAQNAPPWILLTGAASLRRSAGRGAGRLKDRVTRGDWQIDPSDRGPQSIRIYFGGSKLPRDAAGLGFGEKQKGELPGMVERTAGQAEIGAYMPFRQRQCRLDVKTRDSLRIAPLSGYSQSTTTSALSPPRDSSRRL